MFRDNRPEQVPIRAVRAYNGPMANRSDFTFEVDGMTLRGVLHTPAHAPSVCVVISHGFAGYGNSPKWEFMAAGLARSGFPALRFSHRGCGDSDGDFADTTLTGRVRDLRGAMEAVAENTGARVFGLLGSSFGGVTALECSGDPRVRCCVIMGTPADFDFFTDIFPHSNPADAMLEVDGMAVKSGLLIDVKNYDIASAAANAANIMILHGECDELLCADHARRIFKACGEHGELHMVTGADHPFSQEKHQRILLENAIRWA